MMRNADRPSHRRAAWRDQQGASLLTVMVLLLLSLLLVLGAARTALFHERITGIDSDDQRAQEAAHAMLRDAEFEVRGEHPDGTACADASHVGCRPRRLDVAAGIAFLPENLQDWQDLQRALATRTPSCVAGVCVADHVAPAFWNTATGASGLDAMKAVAATYGQYTRATGGAVGSPLLRNDAGSTARAWYWIEVLPYDMAATLDGGNAHRLAPDVQRPFIYRITALAQGLKPGTQAVLQSIVVWKADAS
ncbi:pilus assembly PilX family protein [Variovorax ginsengisoli]|uniref:Type IV pilus assembly protein PilX n=1 Tax=Variovorax ginsengisoli TaxID=363844 RepID=A0ABT9SE74_9BURK|nr:pilus assembly protein [Variovorax ginsengisoli]MDP9902664.1 type IV pilus assembly protein PilX [Variovorax ginsengisoli]